MAVQKKDNSAYNELKRAVSDGTIGKLYLLWGEETYLRDYYFSAMKQKLLPEGLEDMNYKYFEGKSVDVYSLAAAVDCLPVFSERTFIEVRDFDFYSAPKDSRTALAKLFADIPDYCCLTFFFSDPEWKPTANVDIHTAVKKYASSVCFNSPDQSDLTAWVMRRFRALNRNIAKADAEYLIFLCGDLMTSLVTEIEKVASYCSDSVSRRAIDAVATPAISAEVFKMTDAISKKDFNTSARLMGDLLQLRENPNQILAVIGSQLRRIYYARLCLNEGKDYRYLQTLCGMKSDYPAKLAIESAKRFSTEWCAGAVKACADTAFRMNRSFNDGETLLKELLLKLAVAA